MMMATTETATKRYRLPVGISLKVSVMGVFSFARKTPAAAATATDKACFKGKTITAN